MATHGPLATVGSLGQDSNLFQCSWGPTTARERRSKAAARILTDLEGE